MKVTTIANGSQETFDWLDSECQVTGQKLLRFIEKVKVWHYDKLPLSADRGVIMKVYEVSLDDDCQKHLTENDFVFMPRLQDNYEFIIPGSFSAIKQEVTELA